MLISLPPHGGRTDLSICGDIFNAYPAKPEASRLPTYRFPYCIMRSEGIKTPKACEPCRRRKIRCDGGEPCRNCQTQPARCVYRPKARVRKLRPEAQRHSNARNTSPINVSAHLNTTNRPSLSSNALEAQHTAAEIYGSVAATHHAPELADSSQLFYGPSSNFAFLQQIHRATLFPNSRDPGNGINVQEGGAGLDMFMQRSVFFGVSLRTNLDAVSGTVIPQDMAAHFLDNFKTATLYILPLFTAQTLDSLIHRLYNPETDVPLKPQKKALILMVLAIGALGTTQTELAEVLFLRAKREVELYEDAVSLSMIQFALLKADYQLNIGRPNSAFLDLGIACRKGFALGLNTLVGRVLSQGEERIQEHRATVWSLYLYET